MSARHKTQQARILVLLIDAKLAGDGWVPLPRNTRIKELRGQGFQIKNRVEMKDGRKHSWFRLESAPAQSSGDPTEQEPRQEAPHILFGKLPVSPMLAFETGARRSR
jgi:hypothetical protein